MPVSSRLRRKWPSMRPTVGKFWTPAKPRERSWRSNWGMERMGSVAQTPASTGVWFTTGRTSEAMEMTTSLALLGWS